MSAPNYGKLAMWCALALTIPAMVTAQGNVETKKLPNSFLKHVAPKTIHAGGSVAFAKTKKFATKGKSLSPTLDLPGVDSVENWSDQFITPGFDFLGNPQSVWPYTMVGTPPESGLTTHIKAPIIPVTVTLLDANGKVAVSNGHPLIFVVTADIVKAVVNSPAFESFAYASGTGQSMM